MIAKTAGYDWLFIDMEHSSLDVDTAAQISAAALDAGITPIVRVPGHEHFHASRLLDTGALGIVVPHVNNAAEAERAVAHCRFPPQGKRSLPGTLPQAHFDAVPIAELAAAVNEATLVVVMIETPEAVENADAIAAVPGADVLLIGTNDLAAEMGITGQFAHAKVEDAYSKVIAACRRHRQVRRHGRRLRPCADGTLYRAWGALHSQRVRPELPHDRRQGAFVVPSGPRAQAGLRATSPTSAPAADGPLPYLRQGRS